MSLILHHFRTIQAVAIQNLNVNIESRKKYNLITAFLHAIYKRQCLLRYKFAESCEKKVYKLLPEEYKYVNIYGTEFYHLLLRDKEVVGNGIFLKSDVATFRLPVSLQPGYDGNNFSYECEDLDTLIVPLLRCLGPTKTMRVLASMLCENRIIFISKYADTLCACVRAAMAMISQGLLFWRHVTIAVLPPHLFKYLTAGAPYLVGILEKHLNKVDRSKLEDVIRINLDTADVKTYNMADPRKTAPDVMDPKYLKKQKKKYNGVEMLHKDLTDVYEADKKLWAVALNNTESNSETSEIIKKNKNSSVRDVGKSVSENNMGNDKKEEGFFDTAELFVKTFQESSTSLNSDEKNGIMSSMADSEASNVDSNNAQVRVTRPVTKAPYQLCSCAIGEENIKASLICFFMEMYGDIGMYLATSKEDGRSLKVDKKKFLSRKTQLGIAEKSPMYYVVKQFSRSIMFERFVNGFVKDMDRFKKGMVLLDHVPIFSLCQRHLRKSKSEFTTEEIRRVVFATIEGCPEHKYIDKLEQIRDLTLALTGEKAFERESEIEEIKQLMTACKDCNASFGQVVAVCWLRIGETRSNYWKHTHAGLNLLKSLVLRGPMTAVAAANDGIAEIYALCFYENKNADAERLIRAAASELFQLLTHLPLLYLRRRKVEATDFKKKQPPDETIVWSNYLIRRLPRDVGFKHIHVMFAPSENITSSLKIKKNDIAQDAQEQLKMPVSAVDDSMRRKEISRQKARNPNPSYQAREMHSSSERDFYKEDGGGNNAMRGFEPPQRRRESRVIQNRYPNEMVNGGDNFSRSRSSQQFHDIGTGLNSAISKNSRTASYNEFNSRR